MEQQDKKTTQVYGIRPLIEALNSGKTVDKVFIQKGLRGENVAELMTILARNGIEPKIVPAERIDSLTRNNHQGVFAFLAPIEFADIEQIIEQTAQRGENALILILDHITDVRNFGAIVRTAECTGVHAVVIPSEGSAPVSADALKTSAGAMFRVPVCKVKNLTDTVLYMQQSGIQVVAATEKTPKYVYSADLLKPTAIVMGNEEKGISNQLLKACDMSVKLPMEGEIGSLNVSVAAGVFMYEVLRQRSFGFDRL